MEYRGVCRYCFVRAALFIPQPAIVKAVVLLKTSPSLCEGPTWWLYHRLIPYNN